MTYYTTDKQIGFRKKIIMPKAACYRIEKEIANLSDYDAIRTIQKHEGNNRCFGDENPYSSEANGKCSQNCRWLSACERYRSEILPIEKVLSGKKLESILQFREVISESDKFLVHDTLKKNGLGLRVSNLQSLHECTKKLLLASPRIVVTENNDENGDVKPYVLEQSIHQSTVPIAGCKIPYKHHIKILYTSDPVSLFNWVDEIKAFLSNKALMYQPLLHSATETERPSWGDSIYHHTFEPVDLIEYQTPHVAFQDGSISVNLEEFVPLINLELPNLLNTSFVTLHSLMEEFPDELTCLRDYLYSQVDEMRDCSLGSESFYRDVARIERNIRDMIRKLESDLKKHKIKHTLTNFGCAVGTFTISLYCIHAGSDGNDLLKVFGPGGALVTTSQAISGYLVSKLGLRENPAHFLWRLRK